ncbi:MAG TPA: deoxyribodipyrimidine photo-lyase [Frankiaceae bacterium]|nr:deoxyribodipyrimidine photo-lyase [Frankiaceae bacterium]
MAAVLWFRRDLRLSDHPALLAARDAAEASAGVDSPGVVGLFVLDETLRRPSGPARLAFLYRCLRDLDSQLDGRLVVRRGDPVNVVAAVAREAGAQTVHVSADYGPYGAERDRRVEAALADDGRELVRTGSPYAVAPGRVRRADGSPYRVFTPYSRAWRDAGWRPPATRPREVPWLALHGIGIPQDPRLGTTELLPAGEEAARDRLTAFLRSVDGYRDGRDLPAAEATSRLSPYLKYGCIHPRTILQKLPNTAGAKTFMNELAWREFYADVLWHQPRSARADLTDALAGLDYADEKRGQGAQHFEAWKQGKTGYPIVDAGMRQLLAEGWMHNRVRMIVASFLVKDLHIWWRPGARWFLERLVDGDLASNNHGWQWVAGTGTDAAPYFRVFNPVLQGEKFDPEGEYVRRYVPELRALEGKAVHSPWAAVGGPPKGYPAPIVDHAAERKETLARYEQARSTKR